MAKVLIAKRYTEYVRSGTNYPSSDGNEDFRFWYYVYYDNAQDIAGNRTKTITDMYIQVATKSFTKSSGLTLNLNARVNGLDYTSGLPNKTYSVGTTNTGISKEVWVVHNAEGNGSFTWRGTFSGWYSGGTTGTTTYYLPQIPRVSSISNNTADNSRKDIGTNVSFAIDRKSTSFTHNLSYVVNGTTYSLATGAGASVDYTFPISLVNSFTSTTNPNITVKCETYSGGAKIGDANTTVYLHVPSSYIPSCSLAIEDTNSITKAWGIWVKSKSTLKGTITASGTADSTISSYSSNIEGQNFTVNPFSKSLTTSGTVEVTSTATDSRGRKKIDTKSITVLDYNKPSFVSISVQRCDSDGTLNENGTYGKVVCNYSITALSNKNAKSLKVKLGATIKTFTLTNYTGTVTATTVQLFSGLATNTSYYFDFELTDSFETISQTFAVPPSYTLMSKKAGGKGISFGRVAEKDGFNVYMDTEFNGNKIDFHGLTLFEWVDD